MSGHSKWSKVKHQKAATDATRGKLFTKASRAITIAVREGGGIADPDKNFKLRMAVEQAKSVNMPKDTIERAVAKGTGADAGRIDVVLYEAYGPHGVAYIIETATDNKVRTVADVKNMLSRHGGTLADPGSVAYLFERLGIIIIGKEQSSVTSDQLFEYATESGASDFVDTDDVYEIYTQPDDVARVKDRLETHDGVKINDMRIVYIAQAPLAIEDDARQVIEKLSNRLEDLDDVQTIFTNVTDH